MGSGCQRLPKTTLLATLAFIALAQLSSGQAQTDSIRVLINEVELNPQPSLKHIVELYNATSRAVELKGWYILTKQGRKITLPADKTIHAGAFGEFSIQWAFDYRSEVISLYDANGTLMDKTPEAGLRDTADYNWCWARMPDGGSDWVLQTCTLGKSNEGLLALFGQALISLWTSFPPVPLWYFVKLLWGLAGGDFYSEAPQLARYLGRAGPFGLSLLAFVYGLPFLFFGWLLYLLLESDVWPFNIQGIGWFYDTVPVFLFCLMIVSTFCWILCIVTSTAAFMCGIYSLICAVLGSLCIINLCCAELI